MKTIKLFFTTCLFFFSCSQSNDLDNLISNEWERCQEQGKDTIDFSIFIEFDWNTMCYYSGALSLEEIEQDLGLELKEFVDIGDRVIFLNKGKIVYHKYWGLKSSKLEPSGCVFETDLKKFRVNKHNSKFKIRRKEKLILLKKIS